MSLLRQVPRLLVALLSHGLFVWRTAEPNQLRDFCRSQGVDEVYVSVSKPTESDLLHLIATMHHANIRVDALFSSTNADEPGKHRDKLVAEVERIVQFNRRHPDARFDGVHLDIEPQQRPENKGPGNLAYLPGLVDAYRAVRSETDPAGLVVNADIQSKVLKAPAAQRLMLLESLPRFTLMLYQVPLGSADRMMAMAYDGLDAPDLATMSIALRVQDYGDSMPGALRSLDDTEHANPHYGGWARHAY
jgi:hypothetical protein